MQKAFDKGSISFSRSVLEQHLSVFPEHFIRKKADGLIGKGSRGRIAACKRDHSRLGNDLEDLTDRTAGNLIKTVRKGEL